MSKLDHCVISFYSHSGTRLQVTFIIQEIGNHISIGKVHINMFRYTGLQLEHRSEEIYVDQLVCVKELETAPISSGDRAGTCGADGTALLTHNVGAGFWVAGAARPDCAWTACGLSTQFKCAAMGVLRDSSGLIMAFY